jgi:hypothetical protein
LNSGNARSCARAAEFANPDGWGLVEEADRVNALMTFADMRTSRAIYPAGGAIRGALYAILLSLPAWAAVALAFVITVIGR